VLLAALLLAVPLASAGQHGKKKSAEPVEPTPAAEQAAAPEPAPAAAAEPEPEPVVASEASAAPPSASLEATAAPPPRSAGEAIGLSAYALAGASRVTEDRFAAHGSADLALGLSYELPLGFHLGAAYAGRFYEHGYLSTTGDRVAQDERQTDARLVLGCNVLASVTDAVALNVDLAPRYTGFDNAAFRFHGGSLQLGVGLAGRIADQLHLSASGAWSMPFFGTAETASALGLPRHFWDVGAGLGVDLPGKAGMETWSVELKWVGTVVVLDHDTRFYNGAVAGLAVAL
jgi:hypothetical protein